MSAGDVRCAAYEPVSRENPEAGWCGRYRINLDRGGRFCRRCREEAEFRQFLQRQYVARFGPECAGTRSYCEVFGLATTAAQCARCAADGLYRAFLRGQGQIRHDWRGCVHRGEVLRQEERVCCGGRVRVIAFFACALRAEAQEADCCCCREVRLG